MKMSYCDDKLKDVKTCADLVEYMVRTGSCAAILRSFCLKRAFLDDEVTEPLKIWVRAKSSARCNKTEARWIQRIRKTFPSLHDALKQTQVTCETCKGTGQRTWTDYNGNTRQHPCYSCNNKGMHLSWVFTEKEEENDV